MKGIYRIDPQEENNSVHKLDRMIIVTSKPQWLMLLGGVLIVIAAVVWICTGQITETVSATGLYHPSGHEKGEVLAFLPLQNGKRICSGMEVTLYASGYNQQEYGHMKGKITYVDNYVTSIEEMRKLLQNDSLVSAYAQNGPVVAVVCKLQEDPETQSGYYWSSPRGRKIILNDGTFMSMSVKVSNFRPITLGVPALEELMEN